MLLKRIQKLKNDKEALALKYEQEEEFLTNDLTRKLSQVSLLSFYAEKSIFFRFFKWWACTKHVNISSQLVIYNIWYHYRTVKSDITKALLDWIKSKNCVLQAFLHVLIYIYIYIVTSWFFSKFNFILNSYLLSYKVSEMSWPDKLKRNKAGLWTHCWWRFVN